MNLCEKNIFAIPVGDYFKQSPTDFQIIYAPLSDNMMLADKNTVTRIEHFLQNDGDDGEIAELLEQLMEESALKTNSIQTLNDYRVLYVLPNYICNFSCSYCFSAKGRSNKELDKNHLKATLNYFVDAERCKGEPLRITFVGGGEPMMSWKLIKYGLKYSLALAKEQKIKLYFSIITNGSIINEEMLETLTQYDVDVRISFEILKDVQNKQREKYTRVCENIDHLLDAEIKCEVRSMITVDNVSRIEEMVCEMIERFPQINSYFFDPINDAKTFNNKSFTTQFYDTYRASFMKAKLIASQHGKDIKCGVSRGLDSVVERYCNGEFCLTPEGTISICMEVSSPQEEGYEQHVFGRIDSNNKLKVDDNKFKKLRSHDLIYNNPKCNTCFVKWNCGGGCMATNRIYTEEVLDAICESTRQMSAELLLEKLNQIQEESSGISLQRLVDNYSKLSQ